jgi:hypothetical protein
MRSLTKITYDSIDFDTIFNPPQTMPQYLKLFLTISNKSETVIV